MKITSVADALAAMDYLLKRSLMCENCGYRLTKWSNSMHSRCQECKPVHGEYREVKPPNKLEAELCEAIHEWMESPKDGDQ